ncbi:hypothetical protein JKF63_07417 [Porcisia hertigi]|uniref:Surface antigen-like protein n=1 Tax=Porcisia hertigi TaxID=2761500 RepID=A0A837AYA7_9TRYP|nr:hypothetical protein JKF63_07417 [Porcisia hertigi]
MALLTVLTLLCDTSTATADTDIPTTVTDESTQYFVKLWANKYPLNYVWAGNDICRYEGISCDTVKQTVTMLLPKIGLTGTIPGFGSRAGFSPANVRVITINLMLNADLTGPFPAHYGQLTQLQELYLMGTSLRGTVPQLWNSLPNLAIVDVSNTRACGNLPAWDARSMRSLKYMSFKNNTRMRGSIPASLSTFGAISFTTSGAPLCGCAPPEFSRSLPMMLQLARDQPLVNSNNCTTENACLATDLSCSVSNAAAHGYSHTSVAAVVTSIVVTMASLLA